MNPKITEQIREWHESRPFKLAITGGIHAGKTSLASEWIRWMKRLGFLCFGCLEVAVFDSSGNRLGYDFEDIQTGERRAFARISGNSSASQKYAFDETIWPWFESAYHHPATGSVAVFDEFGKLEAAGGGILPFAKRFLSVNQSLGGVIAVCRQSVWNELCLALGEWDWVDMPCANYT